MANIAIIDTGYIQPTVVTGTQATRANSGSAIVFKSAELSYQGGANIDTSERIGSNSAPVAGFGSVTAAKITLKAVLDKNNSSDMLLLPEIDQLRFTYGTKLLYYSSTTDGYDGLVQTLGITNQTDNHITPFFSDTNTPHLHVRVTNVQYREMSSSHIRLTVEMVTT